MQWLIDHWGVFFLFAAISSFFMSSKMAKDSNLGSSQVDDAKPPVAIVDRKVETLGPYEFEQYVAECIELLPQWRAFRTRKAKDKGCDVEAISPSGEKVIFEVKHSKNQVPPRVIRAVSSSRQFFLAKYAVVVTSGPDFSSGTKIEAKKLKVDLWTLKELRLLKEISYGIRTDLPSPMDKMK
jgi:HJR/Mrr/RecB family endonuclease